MVLSPLLGRGLPVSCWSVIITEWNPIIIFSFVRRIVLGVWENMAQP